MSNLKSDQSVDSVISTAFPAPSEARLLEMSEVPRICITRSLNGRVGNIFAPTLSRPWFNSRELPSVRSKTPLPRDSPRQNVPAQDCSKQAILSIASSDTSLVLYPRDLYFGQILSGRSNSFHPDTFWSENRGSFDKFPLAV